LLRQFELDQTDKFFLVFFDNPYAPPNQGSAF
jgi:hypothetical protein